MIEQSVMEDARKGVKLGTSAQSEAISGANQEWYMFTQQIRSILDDSQEAWQLYLENRPEGANFDNPDDAEGSSNIRTSAIAQAVDAVHAQQHLTNFPDQENFFEGRPLNDEAKTNRKMIESYMSQGLRKVDFLIKAFQDRKNLLLDGTSAVAVPFKRKTKRKAKYSWPKIFGIEIPIGKPRKTYVEEVASETTDFIPLRLEDWRIDPTADCWEDTPFLLKYYKKIEELQAIKEYQNTKDLTTYSTTLDESEFIKQQKLEYNGVEDFACMAMDKDGIGKHHALVMERWGDFYINGKHYPNHVLIWANESVFLYFGPNPYDHQEKPFIISQYNPVPNTLYGKASVKDAIPEAHALDDLNNTVLDILHNCALPWATYLDSDPTLEAYVDNEDVPLAPGKMIPVKSHDSIRERTFTLPNLPWIAEWAKTLREDIRESTGGVAYATGGITQEQGSRTLGEVQILANGTSTRFMALVGFYELTKLHRFIHINFENARQFATVPVFLTDFDKVVTPEILKLSEMEFEVTGSRSVMEANKTQQSRLEFMQNVVPALVQGGYAITNGDVLQINIAELAKDAAIDAKIPNVDERFKIVSSNQEISQQADNPMAAQLAAQNQQLTFGSGLDGQEQIQVA